MICIEERLVDALLAALEDEDRDEIARVVMVPAEGESE